MKDFFKFFSLNGIFLFLGLLLSGCTQAPKEVNGQPVQVLDAYLVQPLEINTDKEQQLYFRFKGQPELNTDYLISAAVVHPSVLSDDKTDDKIYWLLNEKLIKNKQMIFELELIHYDKEGKATPVGLRQYLTHDSFTEGITDNKPHFVKKQFEGFHALSFKYGIEKGYSGRANGLAHFNVSNKGGYYRLSIRALQQYRDYPKMKLAVHIAPDVVK